MFVFTINSFLVMRRERERNGTSMFLGVFPAIGHLRMSHMLMVHFKDTERRAEAEGNTLIAPWPSPLETKMSTFVKWDKQEDHRPYF